MRARLFRLALPSLFAHDSRRLLALLAAQWTLLRVRLIGDTERRCEHLPAPAKEAQPPFAPSGCATDALLRALQRQASIFGF